MSSVYQFASYYTNVDLANGLTVNLVEIELALQRNPDQFAGFILFDQAKGKNDEGEGFEIISTAFSTGWNGLQSEAEGGFNQPIWTRTGVAKIKSSKLSREDLENLIITAERDTSRYPEYLKDNLIRTGSSNSHFNYYTYIYGENAKNPIAFNLGISTDFSLLDEMQTGSPASVDYFLQESYNSSLHKGQPHALFFSNHGGSYLLGHNGDGPRFDSDASAKNLQVTELDESLKQAIATYSANKSRFGLIAYDECLMANIETVTQLKDYTRYLLASQETIPGNGYDYFRSLSSFRTQGPLTTKEQIEENSRELALGFISTYSQRNSEENTLSLTDTDAINELNEAIKQYTDALVDSDDNFIIKLLKSIKLKGTNYDYEWLQDLGNVALISKSMPDASQAIIKASTIVLERLDKAIVKNNQNYRPINGYREKGSSGLTITLPTRYDQWRSGEDSQFINSPSDLFKVRAPKFEAQTGWSRVIDKIYPLLLTVQTNSDIEPIKAKRIDAGLTRQKGSSARFALQIDGYLKKTSDDSKINRYISILPSISDATIADLILDLNIITLREVGSITVNIEDQFEQVKASWTQIVSNEDIIRFSVDKVSPTIASQKVEAGDKVVIIPDNTISARYDLNLRIGSQKLNALGQVREDISGPSLLNFSLNLGENQEFSFKTSILPSVSSDNPGKFFTNIVLLSSEETNKRLVITEQGGDKISFATNYFISESIRLDSNTVYKFIIEHIDNGLNDQNILSTDISLLINPDASPVETLKDAVIEIDNSFNNWGMLNINQSLDESVFIIELMSDHRINSIDDLEEGKSISANINSHSVNSQTSLRKNYDGGNQAFSSGIWTTTSDINLNIFIEGKGSNNARLGFYKVDTITGAISTPSGLIFPNNIKQYIDAAIDSMISPMVNLSGFNKEGSLETKFQAGNNYAALLITEDSRGNTTALFSIPNANPNQVIQFLEFGNGYFGFEDLVKGRDSFYDGDFNDVTFYTS